MLIIAIAMLVILAVAGLTMAYAVYPHRGEQLPAAPWLGEAMTKAADALPTLEDQPAESRTTRKH